MKLGQLSLLLAANLHVATGLQHSFTDSEHQDELNSGSSCRERCFTTHVSAYQQVKGPVWMSTSPRDKLSAPVLSGVNGSTWEQWYFDAVSPDGDQSLLLCLARDASYSAMGFGVLRVEFALLLKNGTLVRGTDFLEQSRVQDCCGSIRGEWWDSKEGGQPTRSYSFRVSPDMSRIEGEFHRPEIRGRFVFEADTPPRFADGNTWPSDTASNEMSPLFRYTEPMPGGRAEVSFALAEDSDAQKARTEGKEQQHLNYSWEGLGGHNRLFSSRDWFSIVKGWNMGRARVGPYVISIWENESRLDGKKYQGSMLFKDGIPLVRARLDGTTTTSSSSPTNGADHLVMSRTYHSTRNNQGEEEEEGVSSSWGDLSTGWKLEFVSPLRGKTWEFYMRHKTKHFELGLGGGKGLAGFTEVVSGGEVGAEQYEGGYGMSELVVLPTSLSLKMMAELWWEQISSMDGSPLSKAWKIASSIWK